MNDFYNTSEEGFIERYKDYMESPHNLQLEFATDMFRLIATDTDTSKLTVIPGRCGISKSVFTTALLSYFCTYDHFKYRGKEAIGAVVVTDKLDRLKNFQNDPKHVQSVWGEEKDPIGIMKYSTYISSTDNDKTAMELLIESQYKPIVLLTTQRYFSMSDEQRAMLFEYQYVDHKKSYKMNREILIFDEKPYFSTAIPLKIKNFNDCSTALQDGIPANNKSRDDKDWVLQEYRKFRDKMENLLREKERDSDSTEQFYWMDKNTKNLTSNDERFFEILDEYKTSICKEYPSAMTDFRSFKKLMTEGAFFTTIKKTQHQDYKTYFQLFQDNKDKFYLGQNKVKCFVFDATADIDFDYRLDYVKMINCTKYNVPLKMTINFVDVPASKSTIVNGGNSKDQIKIINETIKDICIHKGFGDTLVITYGNIEKHFKNGDTITGHFGGTTGSNAFIKCSKLAHVGNNRFDHFAYFLKLIAKRPQILESLKTMGEAKSREFLSDAIKLSKTVPKGIFDSSPLNDIMFSTIMADFEQNIFRTAIRNYDNDKDIVVFTFWNCSTFEPLNHMIEERYTPYGVKFEYMGIPTAVTKMKTELRKAKDGGKTIPQKILDWYRKQPKEKVFKLSVMLSELAITNKQFQKAKDKNTSIKNTFEKSITERQGYYKVS